MLVTIVPVQSSFKFGQADTLRIRSISDNLSDNAAFFWQLGKMITPEPTPNNPNPSAVFSPDENATGNATLSGAQYAAWTGANDDLPHRIVSQIGVTLAA